MRCRFYLAHPLGADGNPVNTHGKHWVNKICPGCQAKGYNKTLDKRLKSSQKVATS